MTFAAAAQWPRGQLYFLPHFIMGQIKETSFTPCGGIITWEFGTDICSVCGNRCYEDEFFIFGHLRKEGDPEPVLDPVF